MKYVQPTAEQLAAWRAYVADLPEAVRTVAEHYDPWTLYRLKSTNQRVFLLAFFDPDDHGKVTCRVAVTGEFNLVTHERAVFGIDPDDLEECDLPAPDEMLGSFDFPIEVLSDLMRWYPGGTPAAVMQDLIGKYPLRRVTDTDETP